MSLILCLLTLGPVEATATWTVQRPLGEIVGCLQQHAMSAAAHLPPGMLTEKGADTLGQNLISVEFKWFPAQHYLWFRANLKADVPILRRSHHVTGYTIGEAWGKGPATIFRLTTILESAECGIVPRLIESFGPGRVLGWERDQLLTLLNSE